MAAKTAKFKSVNDRQKLNTRPDLASAGRLGLASGASAPSGTEAIYWGDRLAFKFWLACFALMALMVAYDAVTGMSR